MSRRPQLAITQEMSDFASEDLNLIRATLLGSLKVTNDDATAPIQASWTPRSNRKKRCWQQQPHADQATAEARRATAEEEAQQLRTERDVGDRTCHRGKQYQYVPSPYALPHPIP